jgi:hypothetical protein
MGGIIVSGVRQQEGQAVDFLVAAQIKKLDDNSYSKVLGAYTRSKCIFWCEIRHLKK